MQFERYTEWYVTATPCFNWLRTKAESINSENFSPHHIHISVWIFHSVCNIMWLCKRLKDKNGCVFGICFQLSKIQFHPFIAINTCCLFFFYSVKREKMVGVYVSQDYFYDNILLFAWKWLCSFQIKVNYNNTTTTVWFGLVGWLKYIFSVFYVSTYRAFSDKSDSPYSIKSA